MYDQWMLKWLLQLLFYSISSICVQYHITDTFSFHHLWENCPTYTAIIRDWISYSSLAHFSVSNDIFKSFNNLLRFWKASSDICDTFSLLHIDITHTCLIVTSPIYELYDLLIQMLPNNCYPQSNKFNCSSKCHFASPFTFFSSEKKFWTNFVKNSFTITYFFPNSNKCFYFAKSIYQLSTNS